MNGLVRFFLVSFLNAYALHAAGVSAAFRNGDITLTGMASSGYAESKLEVTNLRSYAVDVDFSTACFIQDNASQRIGLAYEKSTGAYNLRLSAGASYTFYFSSRCLDHNRSGPSTGVSFVSIVDISGFPEIIAALRGNYTQASVWALTDGFGTLAQRWKNADPRPPPGDGTTSGYLNLSGRASWTTSGDHIDIRADKVTNTSTTITSGSIRVRIWATRSRYTGGSMTGYILGTRTLSPLAPGYHYQKIKGKVRYKRPPGGKYFTTITVEEFSDSGWFIQDYLNFSGTSRF